MKVSDFVTFFIVELLWILFIKTNSTLHFLFSHVCKMFNATEYFVNHFGPIQHFAGQKLKFFIPNWQPNCFVAIFFIVFSVPWWKVCFLHAISFTPPILVSDSYRK